MTYMVFVWPMVVAIALCSVAGAFAVAKRSTGVGRLASTCWLLGSTILVMYGLVRLHEQVPGMFRRVGLGLVVLSLLALGVVGALVLSALDAWARRTED